MNVVQIEQTCDTLHVDLFNNIFQRSNSENMTLLNLDFTQALFRNDKWLTSSLLIIYSNSNLVELYIAVSNKVTYMNFLIISSFDEYFATLIWTFQSSNIFKCQDKRFICFIHIISRNQNNWLTKRLTYKVVNTLVIMYCT